jgi:hypothetical protein
MFFLSSASSAADAAAEAADPGEKDDFPEGVRILKEEEE